MLYVLYSIIRTCVGPSVKNIFFLVQFIEHFLIFIRRYGMYRVVQLYFTRAVIFILFISFKLFSYFKINTTSNFRFFFSNGVAAKTQPGRETYSFRNTENFKRSRREQLLFFFNILTFLSLQCLSKKKRKSEKHLAKVIALVKRIRNMCGDVIRRLCGETSKRNVLCKRVRPSYA